MFLFTWLSFYLLSTTTTTTTTTTTSGSSNAMSASKQTEGGIAARLARKNILELQPYRCARDDYGSGVLLDANENAYGPSIGSGNNGEVLERYPDPYQIPLKERLVAYRGHGLRPSNVFCGVGSDEAIDLLMRVFCRPGVDRILTTPPTYGMYKVCAQVNDVSVVNVPLTPEFDLRIPEVRYCAFECAPSGACVWDGPRSRGAIRDRRRSSMATECLPACLPACLTD